MKIRDYIGDAKQLGFIQECKLSEGKLPMLQPEERREICIKYNYIKPE
ncbi:MAG: hypothetical protein HQ557_06380 [Bacteroidetes bacterium]|nr:hypothetical protein [Bacteroidota bacterium]